LRVPQGFKVRVCENEGGGLCRDYASGDYAYVGNDLNDKISYIEVKAQSSAKATFYEHGDFAGKSQSFGVGTYRADKGQLDGVGNDNISSLRVPQGFKVRVCENEGGGLCRDYASGDYAYVGNDLNDKISFIEVKQQ
jgi:hypothetical protein